jgi:signal transduction histidine kinase
LWWNLRFIAAMTVLIRVFPLVLLWLAEPALWQRILVSLVLTSAVVAVAVGIGAAGYLRAGAGALVLGIWGMATYFAWLQAGLQSPGATVYIYLPLLAGTLLSRRAALATALLCVATAAALALAEGRGWLPTVSSSFHPMGRLLIFLSHILFTLIVVAVAIGDLARSLRERERLEASLRQSQKMEALGTLAGGIAHDFNNVLASINLNAELGLATSSPDSEERRSFELIAQGGALGKSLVKRILLFARKQAPERTVLELGPLLKEALALLRPTIPANVRVQVELAEDLPPVFADRTQIHQVLLNLATNALQAMREKGGELRFQAAAAERGALPAGPAGALPGRYLSLRVEDSGPGIPPEILDRIFEPFFSTRGSEGTGLGLSVVHGIVKEHGGQISVSDRPGGGAAFVLLLPVPAKQS